MKHKIFILLSVVFSFFTNAYGQDTISNDTTEWIPLKDGEYKHYYKRIGNRIYPAKDNCIDYRYFKNVDIETFKVHKNARYAKDKNNLYYHASICCGCSEDYVSDVEYDDDYFEGPIIPNVNPNSFLVLKNGNHGDYGTDGINIYHGGSIIKRADVHSFKILNRYYSTDKNTVFYFNRIVNEADRKSFRAFDYDDYSPYEYCAADKYNLYERGVKFTNANPNKVRFLDGYIADDKNVYDNYNGFLIEGRDGKTFQVLNQNYTKDKNGGYDVNGKIEGSDGKTFQSLGEGYSKDKNSVYYHSTKIEGVDAKTFQVVSLCFTKDKNNVYYWLRPTEKRVIENADPKTFQLLSEELAIESDVYRYHAKDKNYVFYHTQIIEGADLETFEYLKDQNGVYCSDKWIDKNFYYYIDNKTGRINKEKIAK